MSAKTGTFYRGKPIPNRKDLFVVKKHCRINKTDLKKVKTF